MLIDWFTIIAQIVNFLILVALLKHFLYGRIVDAMDEREEKIASRLEEARKEKEEAREESERYRRKEQELESKKDELLSQAKEEAERRRDEFLREVREEVDRHEEKWRGALERKKKSFFEELRERSGHQVLVIARRALGDLAEADLEKRIIEVFVEKLESLDEDGRGRLLSSAASEPVRVNSRFEVDQGGKQKISRALREIAGESVEIEYSTAEEVIMGIELRTGGFRLAWSVDRYLEELESRVRGTLDELGRKTEGAEEEETRGEKEEEEEKDRAEGEEEQKEGAGGKE